AMRWPRGGRRRSTMSAATWPCSVTSAPMPMKVIQTSISSGSLRLQSPVEAPRLRATMVTRVSASDETRIALTTATSARASQRAKAGARAASPSVCSTPGRLLGRQDGVHRVLAELLARALVGAGERGAEGLHRARVVLGRIADLPAAALDRRYELVALRPDLLVVLAGEALGGFVHDLAVGCRLLVPPGLVGDPDVGAVRRDDHHVRRDLDHLLVHERIERRVD